MGSFGNEIGDLIQRYARSIKELKLAGAEFSFTERSQQQGDPALGSTPLAGNARAYLSPGGSSGLQYLSHMDEIIYRDVGYINLFSPSEVSLVSVLRDAQNFAGKKITPPFKCLAGWLSIATDTTVVNQLLESFNESFRKWEVADSVELRSEVGKDFVRSSLRTALEVVTSKNNTDVWNNCHDLLTQLCPNEISAQFNLIEVRPSYCFLSEKLQN